MSFRKIGQRWYYLDAPLQLSYDHYKIRVGAKMRREAFARELAGYETSAGIVLMSNFAANSVLRITSAPRLSRRARASISFSPS